MMNLRLLAAALAVIAVPVAAGGQGSDTPAPKPERRICETSTDLGTRLGSVRRCRTKAEREAHKQEARRTVDRIQALKPTFEK